MRALLAVLRKDLLVEWRARANTVALVAFALNLLLVFSFAVGPDSETLRQHAGAYLWVGVLLASTLLLQRSFLVETESGAIETVLLAPAPLPALFYGKALANTAQLLVLCAAALPAVLVLFGAAVVGPPHLLFVTLLVGCAGLAAPGTLYAALTARMQGQQVLLPLLLFPLVVPVVLATVKALNLLLLGDPMEQLGSWIQLLCAFDLVFWSLGGVLFPRIIES